MRPQLRGIFQRRHAGDDALMELARVRFEQAGLGAELYAHDADELERMLAFVPDVPLDPTVHLHRGLDLRAAGDRATVAAFARRFAGRVGGFVVHDQRHMAGHTDALVAALHDLDGEVAGLGPTVFLEYASGHPLEWFGDLAERLAGLRSVSLCIDVGHVGIHQARQTFAAAHPGVEPTELRGDALAQVAGDVQAAVDSALPAVVELTSVVSRVGAPLHLHLHDGHPLIPGVSDHFSFLMRLPVPFTYDGRRALDPLYGPDGLRAIVAAADEAAAVSAPSLTLEIHQAEGRRPLGDAADLFAHWTDVTNAERTNHWLAVLAENARLL